MHSGRYFVKSDSAGLYNLSRRFKLSTVVNSGLYRYREDESI